MAVIRIQAFGGEMPSTAPRSLPEQMAQVARNLIASTPEFRPAMNASSVASSGVSNPATIHRLARTSGGAFNDNMASGWIANASEVQYVKGQIDDDLTERTYYTFGDGSAPPRVLDATGQDRQLGVPAPSTAPAATVNVVDELTITEATQWSSDTLVPAIIDATKANLVMSDPTWRYASGLPVAGPYSLHGMSLPSYPTSQRGLSEPWMLLASVSTSSAATSGLDDPRLGGVVVGSNLWIGINALPAWPTVTSASALQTSLLAITDPVSGTALWTSAQALSVANDLVEWFSPTSSHAGLKSARDQLDSVVTRFMTAFNYVLASSPTLPTEPTKPTVAEYTIDSGTGNLVRDAAWVTYDAALATYQANLQSYQSSVAEISSERSARISTMVDLQNQAVALSGQLESILSWDLLKADLEKQALVKLEKTASNPDGLVTVTTRILEDRFYIQTFVTDWDEESAPSPVSTIVTLDQNDTVALTLASPPSGRHITKSRIYRTNVGSASAAFQFVAEVTGTSYTDSKKGAELGEVCPTLTWAEPPSNLQGLVGMPNGIMAGFFGNTVCFCDPYHPYAWPVEYQITTEYPIVGLAVYGQTLVVGTRGNPYLMSGADSASMSALKLDANQACVSRRSMVTTDAGVIYASPDGLCLANPSGVKCVTNGDAGGQPIWVREDWQALNPSSIIAAEHEGIYVFLYSGGCYALGDGKLVRLDITGSALYMDKVTDMLYVASGTSILGAFLSGRRTGLWRSKRFMLSQHAAYAWVQLAGDYSAAATVRIYADGALFHTATLSSNTPQRVPPGRFKEWEVELESTARVTELTLASSTAELQAA